MHKSIKTLLSGLLFLSLLSSSVLAQDFKDSFWYFGDTENGIQFSKDQNRSPNSISNQAIPFGNLSAAVASNSLNGQLQFYTDGANIYGRNHAVMPGGVINADPSRRNVVAISPSPVANSEFYYVYFIATTGELQYVSVDMTAGTFGEVNSAAPIGTGITNLSNYLQAVRTRDNYYLIYQTLGDNTLKVSSIQNGGTLSATPTGSHTFSIPFALNGMDFHRVDETQMRIALSSDNISGSPKNIILLDLFGDLSTPNFLNEEIILNSGQLNSNISDVGWSAGGSKLYFSRNNTSTNSAQLIQYDPNTQNMINILNRTISEVSALQKGPDNELYFLYERNSSRVGQIQFADSVADSVNIDWNGIAGNYGGAKVFPQIAPSSIIDAPVDFDWYDSQLNNTLCQNNNVSFFPEYNDLDDLSSISWDFGDGQTSNAISPNVVYENPGSYRVLMTINAGGNILIDSSTVIVNAMSSQVQLQDTTVCELPLENYGPTLTDGSQPDEVVWINPDPEKFTDNGDGTATFLQSGTYSAAVTVGGCTVTASFTLTLFTEGKQVANFWYFGDGAGIDFSDEAGPLAVTDGQITAAEGCATVSDENGDLLFYTNGETVWNSEHAVMANGTDIGGSADASQGVIVVGHGSDASLYYIFLVEEEASTTKSFKVALLDMKLNNGLGDIVLKNRKIFSESMEKIAASGTANTNVLTHELGTNNFRSYSVNDQGINYPDFVGEGNTFLSDESVRGYIKYAAGGDKIAHAYNDNGAFIDFIRNDSANGFEYAQIDVDFGGDVYGLEFSPSGDLLYATLNNGGSSSLIQIPVNDAYTIAEIENPDSVTVADLSFEAGAIQIAPNGTIYIASNNTSQLFAIGSPDVRYDPTEGTLLANSLQPFDLAGRNSRLGLPNFIQNLASPEQVPSISVIATCENEPIILSGVGVTNFDNYSWTITPAGQSGSVYTSNTQNDTLTDVQLDPGQYEVALRITNECGYDNLLVQNIELFATPDLTGIISPRTFCGDTLTLGTNIADVAGQTYLWSTGETTREIVITSEGFYTVTVTSVNGCTASAEIFAGPPFDVDLGGDQFVCQDENVVLNANVNANTYDWYIDDVLQQSDTTQTFNLPTTVAGIYNVRVAIPDPIDPNCFATDEVLITVNATPTITTNSTTPPVCGLSNGEINISVNSASGDHTISWTGPTSVADNTLVATGLAAGSYNITATDNLTGCTEVQTVTLSNTNFTIDNIIQSNNCPPNVQDINVTVGGTFSFNLNWSVLDQNNAVVSSGSSFTNPFDITNLTAGDYSLEIIDNNGTGCLAASAFSINPSDSVNFAPDENVFSCGPYDLEAYVQSLAPAATFTYSPNPADVNAINATTTFTITATEAGVCPTTADITVNVSPSAEVNTIENNVNCNGGNDLTAVLVSGNPADYSFSWSNGAQGQTITVTQTGTYTVTVYPNSNVSCVDTETITVSEIYQALEADLISTTNCEDGTILLSAQVSGGSGNYFTTLTNANGVNIPSTDPANGALEWLITESGDYRFEVSDQGIGSCDPIVIIRSLSVQAAFEPTLQDTYFICSTGLESERTVILDPGSFGSYEWTLSNGTTSTNRTVTATEPGNYEVTLRAAGCEFTVSTIVLEDCKPKVFAPNAVRPASSQAQNRTFSVFYNDYVGDFQVLIFNRWGELVYQANDKAFQWDTTDFSGERVPQGTYAYVITYRSTDTNNARVYEERGSVTVVR